MISQVYNYIPHLIVIGIEPLLAVQFGTKEDNIVTDHRSQLLMGHNTSELVVLSFMTHNPQCSALYYVKISIIVVMYMTGV